MKNLSRHSLMLFGLLTMLTAVTGCHTVSINANQYVGVPRFAPTNPADIEILRAEPARPCVKIGEVRAEPSTDSVSVEQIEEALRQAAAKMGANAVVIISDRMETVGAFESGPLMGRRWSPIQGRVVVGVAIRYQ
jgi:hypothetical protein